MNSKTAPVWSGPVKFRFGFMGIGVHFVLILLAVYGLQGLVPVLPLFLLLIWMVTLLVVGGGLGIWGYTRASYVFAGMSLCAGVNTILGFTLGFGLGQAVISFLIALGILYLAVRR